LGWAIGRTVSAATWPWNLDFAVCHMALVGPYGGAEAIYESTIDKGLGPCLHAHRDDVKGVQVHPLEGRLRLHLAGRMGRAWRLPLTRPNSWASLDHLEQACVARLGVPYDLLGAFQARTFGFGWTRRFRRTRTDANRKFYCNEFCLDVFRDIGWAGAGVIPSNENPKSTVALLVKRGICDEPEEILL